MVSGRIANSLVQTGPGGGENRCIQQSVMVFRLLIVHPGPQCACLEKVLWV